MKSDQECVDISRALVAADPSAGQDRRYLWYCMMKMGADQVRRGDFADGLTTLRDSLALGREGLATTGSAEAARDVVLALYSLADAQVVSGAAADGLKSAQDGLESARKVAAADPTSSESARDVVVALYVLGDAQAAAGDFADALKADQEALRNARELSASAQTSTTQMQSDVAVTLARLGAVETASGDLAGALRDGRESLEIARRLAALDPSSSEAKRDVALSLTLMAKLSGSGVGWADVAAQFGAMKAAGILAEGDEPRLAEAQTHAAAGAHDPK